MGYKVQAYYIANFARFTFVAMYGDELQPSSISLNVVDLRSPFSMVGPRVLRRPVVLSTLLRSTPELKALAAISHPPRHR